MRRTAIAIVAVLVGATACTNPFATGTPDPPGGSGPTYPQPSSPENVLEILRLALGAKDNPAYLERLSPGFTFSPDPVQRQSDAFASFPGEWTLAEEEVFLAGLFSNADSLSLDWSGILTTPEGDASNVTASYALRVWTRGGDTTTYRGRADMLMLQAAGVWSIESWSDVVQNDDTTTWGLLRALLLGSG